MTFRKIDGRIGGGVDDHIGPGSVQCSEDRGRLQQIKLGPTQRDDFDARLRTTLLERANDLALRSSDDQTQTFFHDTLPDQKYAGSDENAGCRASFSDRTALSFVHRPADRKIRIVPCDPEDHWRANKIR